MRTPLDPLPPYNPWPDRILFAGCVVIIGLAGTLLLCGMFGMLDNFFPL